MITNHPGALQTPDVMGPKLGRAAEGVAQEINIAFRSHRHAPRGHLELLLLATLAESEGHGYALTERLRVRSDGALQLGEGSVFAALHRLERGEFAKSRGERGSAAGNASTRSQPPGVRNWASNRRGPYGSGSLATGTHLYLLLHRALLWRSG